MLGLTPEFKLRDRCKAIKVPNALCRDVNAYVTVVVWYVSCSSLNLPILCHGISRQRMLWKTSAHCGTHPLNYGIWLQICLHQPAAKLGILALFHSEVSAAARQTFWMTCLLLFSPSGLTARRTANLRCHEKRRKGFASVRR